ncbi:uncharacterized protein PV07_12745 [Cladophialophora immunda]|uniref:Uncharacterized protein n=1 Tax=Cladophialophora immunda TaxID=569365 RepID=A0A0D1Z2D3_9EURO|nr:uncharacterized protein PV07_12745 [Cladophialophora immunda]KIW21831.1 hypothetical protein PV07_12745 [Cladophialophora immunda]
MTRDDRVAPTSSSIPSPLEYGPDHVFSPGTGTWADWSSTTTQGINRTETMVHTATAVHWQNNTWALWGASSTPKERGTKVPPTTTFPSQIPTPDVGSNTTEHWTSHARPSSSTRARTGAGGTDQRSSAWNDWTKSAVSITVIPAPSKTPTPQWRTTTTEAWIGWTTPEFVSSTPTITLVNSMSATDTRTSLRASEGPSKSGCACRPPQINTTSSDSSTWRDWTPELVASTTNSAAQVSSGLPHPVTVLTPTRGNYSTTLTPSIPVTGSSIPAFGDGNRPRLAFFNYVIIALLMLIG